MEENKETQITKGTIVRTIMFAIVVINMILKAVGIEVISKLMGHANISITYNKYIHSIQEEEAKAMTMIRVC